MEMIPTIACARDSFENSLELITSGLYAWLLILRLLPVKAKRKALFKNVWSWRKKSRILPKETPCLVFEGTGSTLDVKLIVGEEGFGPFWVPEVSFKNRVFALLAGLIGRAVSPMVWHECEVEGCGSFNSVVSGISFVGIWPGK